MGGPWLPEHPLSASSPCSADRTLRLVAFAAALRRCGWIGHLAAAGALVLPMAVAAQPLPQAQPLPLPQSQPPGSAAAADAPGPAVAAPPATTRLTGLVTIESDLQKADNGTGVITASGNVRIVYGDQGVVATARQAQYFSREGRVVLSGDVEVIQEGGNRLLAERLVYLVEQERLVAYPEPGQQVTSRVRLPSPQASATAPAPAAPSPALLPQTPAGEAPLPRPAPAPGPVLP